MLQQKYQELINAARTHGISNLQVREQGNVLYIDGQAPTEEAKRQLWNIYNRIDPDYRSGDLVMNLSAPEETEEYVVVSGDSLSKIGQRHGVSWREIYEANRDQIKDPDLIQPGWRLKIPRKSS
ncbi:MAG TPA: LysM peptidoglycan-binding domain-containing protein [Chitinophagaceae bacterium]|nr:LysM peptidoglycan-binding domain-containing protein [Chitinophagaceae bacterium]